MLRFLTAGFNIHVVCPGTTLLISIWMTLDFYGMCQYILRSFATYHSNHSFSGGKICPMALLMTACPPFFRLENASLLRHCTVFKH